MAGRKVQRNVGKQARKVTPRRRRSKMKLGKLGMVVGGAVGYVLGAKAGRERYEQITASARQLLDKPQVKKVMDSVPGDLGARVEQVANKAADKVQEAGDKVAASGPGTSGTSGCHHREPHHHHHPQARRQRAQAQEQLTRREPHGAGSAAGSVRW
jgi:hypothetical protein